MIEEEIRNKKIDTYQKCMEDLANDFNHGVLTFDEFEYRKKELHVDIFG